MPCNKIYLVRDDEGKFRIFESGDSSYLWASGCPDPCSCDRPPNDCNCYPIDDPVIGSNYDIVCWDPICTTPSPPGVIPPPSRTFYIPRYADVRIWDSDAVAFFREGWEVWSPNGVCDSGVPPFGEPGGALGVTFNTLSGIFVEPCNPDNGQRFGTITVEWDNTAHEWKIDCDYAAPDCTSGEGCNGGLMNETFPLQIRWRRAYGDFVTSEKQRWLWNENCLFSTHDPSAYTNSGVMLDIDFQNSCRVPATGIACDCEDSTFDVIDVYSLPSYQGPPIECLGRPIDIDVECGDISSITEWTMYYRPVPNTVPVIDGIAYDTTQVTIQPAPILTVVKIRTFSNQDEVRNWLCKHLRFGTVGAGWPGNPNDIEYDWPYNDVYFNACDPGGGGGGGGGVDLVPC